MDLYLSPDGSDDNSGISLRPLKTLGQAQRLIRESGLLGQEPVTVHLTPGSYYLDEPLVLTSEDSGAESAPVTFTATRAGAAILSGGSALRLDWQPLRDGIWQASTPSGLEFDQLFVNGQRQIMARYPNFDPEVRPYGGYSADAISPERAAGWADPSGGYIHAMHSHDWGGYHYRITGKNPDGTLAYEGGWQNNRQMGMHEEYRYVENIAEELDAPGEWFHDTASQTLMFYPPDGLDLDGARIEVARLRHLVTFDATPEHPVRHVYLNGLVFRHAARTFMDTREPLLRSDWTIYRGGAVTMTGTEDCRITDCEFDQVGGNAVFVNRYNRRLWIAGTHIHGAGASGVCFVGNPAAVRSPLFEYNERQSLADLDPVLGPNGIDYPAECVVEDCLIHQVGVVEKQAAGVQISMSRAITVRHCSIYDVGRAGININEGTFGGHRIEFCDVFDTVLETGDHGSFNSWGRDRFWELSAAPPELLPELARLDGEVTVIAHSRWRCDHGWDVDLDDGSSNYEIHHNLFLHGGLKLREGFHRSVRNNIAVNNGLHPHVWYVGSGDVVTGNIFMAAARPIKMNGWGDVDRNLYLTEADRDAMAEHGWDAHSVAGDPMFIDPEHGDFRVQDDSPAFDIGFTNFAMDKFGVQKPALKAIARTPEFPEIPEMAQEPEISS